MILKEYRKKLCSAALNKEASKRENITYVKIGVA
jgi:hypothetical protein